ncbi:response regulator [Bradyrhizobium sp. SZCCHNS2005]|uniref:response regulator n=1 Tax=Bradyrhizobium sp. SZCCHNS2005 TaxID=3057303 RepID=UPI0028E96F30|nr:response regulator [Bradyrhizobium sp. SZCCHNS2005]
MNDSYHFLDDVAAFATMLQGVFVVHWRLWMHSLYEKLSVLVVDDDPTFATTVAFLLSRIGVGQIGVLHEVGSAWSFLNATPVDVVISDWNMEPADGYQLLRMVRRSRRLALLGFIMMTANRSEQYPCLAIEAGATFFLVKPFRMSSLKAALDATLSEMPGQTPFAQVRLEGSTGRRPEWG